MNGKMQRCDEDKQPECEQYQAKSDKELVCLWFRKDFLGKNGGSICTAPPKENKE